MSLFYIGYLIALSFVLSLIAIRARFFNSPRGISFFLGFSAYLITLLFQIKVSPPDFMGLSLLQQFVAYLFSFLPDDWTWNTARCSLKA